MKTPQFLLKGYKYIIGPDLFGDYGCHYYFEFNNGYGASVVSNQYSHGGSEGLWELAVLDSGGHVTYDTPITKDVEGYLTDQEVADLLDKINDLVFTTVTKELLKLN